MTTLDRGTSLGVSAEEWFFPSYSAHKSRTSSMVRKSNAVAVAAVLAGTTAQATNLDTEQQRKAETESAWLSITPPETFSRASIRFSTNPKKTQTRNLERDDLDVGRVASPIHLGAEQPGTVKGSTRKSDESVANLIRSQYLSQVLRGLEKVRQNTGDLRSAAEVGAVFKAINALSDVSPFDPFLRILLPFYDSLAYQNRWMGFSEAQYDQAANILKLAGDRDSLNDSLINSTITQLEKAGFSSLPFEVTFEEDEA